MNIHKIIDIIIANIKAESLDDKRFNAALINGLANLFQKDEDSVYGPYACDNSGDGKWVGFDDSFPAQIYFKNNGSTYPKADASKQVNTKGKIIEQYNLSIIAMAWRSQIKMSAEELNNLLIKGLPDSLTQIQLQDFKLNGCSIYPVATDYNSAAILLREYKGQNIKFEPDMIMFELKFITECIFKKDCINTECC